MSFDPAIGGEIRKTRPAIIVSNDAANKVLNRLQVVPLSSQVQKLYPCEALVTLQAKPCKAMADQIATVSKARCREYMGQILPEEMAGVERALKIQLGLT